VVCNGAFVLERWDFKQAIWLRRNPWYWERGAIGVDTIEAWIVSNPNAALLAYETGRADYVRGLERSVAQALMARGREDFHTGPRFATFFFRVNCQREPLVRADLRKALALAIDREAICDHVMRLCETPAWTFVPRSALHLMPRRDAAGEVVSYEPPAGLGAGRSRTECVALAREYLRRSGYDRETEGRPLEVAFAPGDPEQQAIAEAVQAMWERDLGIRVALRTQEATVLSTRILQLDYDLARSNWFGDYLDPSTFLEMFASESGQNRTGWAHAGYDALLAAAAAESDDRRRFALLREAERILCEEELPILPVFHRCGNYLLRPRFGGVGDNVRDLLAVHRVRSED
jgi:oligopeptide transport system substrate-binding protein